MKVVLTDNAIADLIKIGRFIQDDNPTRAVTFVAELEDRCMRLGSMPKAFPLIVGHEKEGIRRRPHGNYLIFYWVKKNTVEILHVLNGAMDYETILFPDE
ncbi:type II toxin-antitoxin system RelE/ParE family toxin [Roseibium aggregatum]|uniref:Type II toxin-antitoxin system RelE/ParE family toxin n=1 Tax=Roseibium aggregatum TaxID=187304 RepID=A0A926S7D5_9HYPH|nr:type II toxin-antitoxin system RelE/ParE family toxin [Roseibium aggregatum]MBD1549533.1 type II toxin-antitoxin system RelE/ParE family toxin [Roseibium aggregatum]